MMLTLCSLYEQLHVFDMPALSVQDNVMQIPVKFYHIIYTLFYFFLLLLPLFHFFKHAYITTKCSSCIKKSMQPESENNLQKVS